MERELTEKDLIAKGFTEKNIARLREVLSRKESGNESYRSLIDDLSKRFIAGIICAILIFIPFFILPAIYPGSLVLYYIPVALFGFFAVYFLIPMNLSWKAYRLVKDLK